MLARMRSHWNSHSLLVLLWRQNGTAAVEDIVAVSYQTKQALTMQSGVTRLGIYPNEVKGMSTQKPKQGSLWQLHSHWPKPEAANMSFSR